MTDTLLLSSVPLAAFSLASLGAKALSLLYVALGLGFVIFFHELGHFAVAKWCGVKVERFSIGFGPVLLSKTTGGTEYALSAFPLGGYVKMLGQDDIDPSQLTSEEIAEDPRSYSAKPVWQRMAIISAGVVMNLLTAVLFFAVACGLGLSVLEPSVGAVTAGGPAWKAGVESGDRLDRINGRRITEFGDVIRAVALSWGDTLRLEGTRADGSPLDVVVDPDDTGLRRRVGLGPGRSLSLAALPDGSVVSPGTPAAAVGGRLEKGDTVTAARVLPGTNEDADAAETEPVEFASYVEFEDLAARNAHRPLELTVRRVPEKDASPSEKPTTFTVTVPPAPVRTFGLTVVHGKVAAIRTGSPAEAASLLPGDRLLRADGQEIGRELDPLRLPGFFADRAGTPVAVSVERTEGGGSPRVLDLSVVPDDRPGWVERPSTGDEPLSVPALGLAFHLTPGVLAVAPGGPADAAGIKPDDRILKAVFTAPAVGDDDPEVTEIAFENDEVDPWNPWGAVFARAQERPDEALELTVARGGKDGAAFVAEIDPAPADGWYFPDRGLLFGGEVVERKSENAAAALADGLAETRASVEEMYLTLGSLLTGRLSIQNLRGPPGILSEGMKFAEGGVATFLVFLGFLSVNLAVLNFLPIPVLDGGHMVWLLWEAVTRKKPSEQLVIAATWVGLGMIVALMLTVIYLDIFVHRVFGG